VRAVQITEFGGPDVLRLTEVEDPAPKPGQLLIDVESAGINYADTHQAEDSYLARQTLPMIPGSEVVGRVRDGALAGRRVVALTTTGGYAERSVVDSSMAYPLTDDLTDAQALALLVQGTTAWHLLRTSTHLSPGETVVVHSAAGGVGHLAVQLAKAWGAARVIGTASGERKCELVRSLGADAAIDISQTVDADQVTTAIREANGGRPVNVVLEMTGGHVFEGSLSALAPLGRLAVFGMASRVPPPKLQVTGLMATSRSVIGFWLPHVFRLPGGGLAQPLEELTSMVRVGRLTPVSGGSYALADAAAAHLALRSRDTIGKLILQVACPPTAPTPTAPDTTLAANISGAS
jgi:NADPH2:quinone reductase